MKTKRIVTGVLLTLACGAALPESAAGAVVMDQIGQVNAYGYGVSPTISQIFTDFTGYDCMGIDDFTVSGSELRITHVSALVQAGGGFAGFQNVTGYQLSIFSSPAEAAASLTGNVANLLLVAGSGASVTQINGGDVGLVDLVVDILLPAAGTYWVGISPVAADYLAGRFYLQYDGTQGAATPGNDNGRFASPDDGFGTGTMLPMTVDFAYAVTAVPEPAASLLGILGGCGWLCRRRRSSDSSTDQSKIKIQLS
jgi:hypothetical protein